MLSLQKHNNKKSKKSSSKQKIKNVFPKTQGLIM